MCACLLNRVHVSNIFHIRRTAKKLFKFVANVWSAELNSWKNWEKKTICLISKDALCATHAQHHHHHHASLVFYMSHAIMTIRWDRFFSVFSIFLIYFFFTVFIIIISMFTLLCSLTKEKLKRMKKLIAMEQQAYTNIIYWNCVEKTNCHRLYGNCYTKLLHIFDIIIIWFIFQ